MARSVSLGASRSSEEGRAAVIPGQFQQIYAGAVGFSISDASDDDHRIQLRHPHAPGVVLGQLPVLDPQLCVVMGQTAEEQRQDSGLSAYCALDKPCPNIVRGSL